MNNLSKIAVITLGLISLTAQAELAGAQSDAANTVNYIAVGGTNYTNDASPGHAGVVGSPGIMVNKMSPVPDDRKYVSLLGLQVVAWPNWLDGVTHVDKNSFGVPAKHKEKIGTLDFARVRVFGGTEVYFGEWSQNGELNAPDRQVWYVGKDKTTNMPTGGIANYDVKGIRQYQHNGILSGTLIANFGSNELYGNVGDISFGSAGNTTVSINASQASFGGGVSVGSVQGTTQGHFFGAAAKDIAGIATFATNKNLDTAFGGKKN